MDTGLLVATGTNCLALASMYILVALGFAFLFNMLGIFNLAHGAIYMIGAFLCYELVQGLLLNNWLAFALSTVIVAALGVFLERFCFRPFVGDFNRILMVCVMITVILQTSANIMAGAKSSQAIPPFIEGIFRSGPVSVSYERILTFTMGIILLGVIMWFVSRTRLGMQMQAISQNIEAAALQGINVNRVSSIASTLGCGLAAIAGCLMAAHLYVAPFMGINMMVKVLILVMLAGVGSIGGILITGLALGTIDATLPVVFMYGAASDAVALIIVVTIILIRPQGFFGHEA
jgi:branched-chain amino acid transport system permease protein